MWIYEKKMQYPVNIKNANPRLAKVIISQLGGPDGELGASLRYMCQRYAMPQAKVKGLLTDIPREASEMFHSTNSAQNPAFCGLWVHSLKTSDKVLKYGENNRVDFSEHPTVVKRGSVRTINIYAAVPDVA